jgi:hypothetical protein
MKENYLHQIWKNKRLPFHQLKLVSGQDFTLIHQGMHNNESGPDFFCGKVKIDNIIWTGNIEIHKKSSDWFLHKHHLDKAYNNVILHVVYENDRQVFINNRELATVELKNYLDNSHLSFYTSYKKAEFTCQNLIQEIDDVYLESMKSKVIVDRLNRKSQLINFQGAITFNQSLFVFLANSFGNKVNSACFFELAQHISIRILKRIHRDHIIIVILGVAGFYELNNSSAEEKLIWDFYKVKYELKEMNLFQWKRKGVYPSGFPIERISQLSILVQNFDFNLDFMDKSAGEIINFIFDIFNKNGSKALITPSFINLIIINGFIPFMWGYSIKIDDLKLKEKVFEVLFLLKTENNSILKKWKKVGVESKKAFDSQALLEIYNQFCSNKRCLSCSVGNKILNI